MARDLTPGRIGLRTAMRLGMASPIAMMLTTTIARKDDGSSFSSMTINTIPAEASPNVRSKTHMNTVECLSETQPQQQEVARLKHFKNLVSAVDLEATTWSSTGMPGPGSIGESSAVTSMI